MLNIVQEHGSKPQSSSQMTDVMKCPNRKICLTPLQYNLDKPETLNAQTWLFLRENENKKFQQFVHLKCKLHDLYINLKY